MDKGKYETFPDCSDCDYKYITYGESDTGYEEWSCSLLEGFLLDKYQLGYEFEEKECPLKIKYTISREEMN